VADKTVLDWIALVLVIVGGINWGLVSLLNFNLVEVIFRIPVLTKIVYTLVGLSGLYMIYYLKKE
jgi:uncharacterized membrane protein YuzA (DUF378 family)